MGNRAVITTAPFSEDNAGIYVHWNGGRASIEAYLRVAKTLGYRSPTEDPSYGLANLMRIIGIYSGLEDGLSVGIGRCGELDCDNYDNGVYLIGDWTIVGREYKPDDEEEIDEAKTQSIYNTILAKISAAKAVKHS